MTQTLTIEELRTLRQMSLQLLRKVRQAIRRWWSSGCCALQVLTQLEIIKAKVENFIARIEIAIREQMIKETELISYTY